MNYQVSIYLMQQLLSRLLYNKLFIYSPLFFLFILFSGIITSLNPCIISTLPIILTEFNSNHRWFLSSFFFFLGLLSVNLLLGFILLVMGYQYYLITTTLPLVSAVFSILISLFILQILSLDFSFNQEKISFVYFSNIYIKNFGLGVLVSINIVPCTLPIICTIFNLLLAINNMMFLSLYSLVYILGFILPFLFFYFFIQQVQQIKVFKIFTINRFYSLLGGSFLLSSGVYKLLKVLFYNLI